MKIEILKPKFFPGEKVYCYTNDGLKLCTIDSVHTHIYIDSQSVSYYILENRHVSYDENQIIDSLVKAKKKLIDNSNQLQLAIS